VERRAKLQARLSALRQDLDTLRSLTVDFNNLEARANELKENYRLYAQKRDRHNRRRHGRTQPDDVAVAQRPHWRTSRRDQTL